MSIPYLYYIGNGIYKITINNLLFGDSNSYKLSSDQKLIIPDKYDFLNMDHNEEYLIYLDGILYLYLQHTFLCNYFSRCNQSEKALLKICEHVDNSFKLERVDMNNANEAITTITAIEHNIRLEKRKYVLDPWIKPIPIPAPLDGCELPNNHIIFNYMASYELPDSHNECLDNLENSGDTFMSVPFSWFIWGSDKWGSYISWKILKVYRNNTLLYCSEFPRVESDCWFDYMYRPRIYREVEAHPYCCGAGSFFACRVFKQELCYDPQFIDNTNKLFCIGCQHFLPLYESLYCNKCTIDRCKTKKTTRRY